MTRPTNEEKLDFDQEQSDSGSSSLTFADLLPILQRRWIIASLAFILVAALVFVTMLRTTPLYEARAVITVDYGLKALDFQRDSESERVELNMLNTIRDQIIAVPVLRETIVAAGLVSASAYRTSTDPASILKSRVKANTAKDSLSITITLRDEYPERAQKALSVLIATYQGKLAAAKDDKSQNALVFLRAQRDEELGRLEIARAAETEYMNKAGIVSNSSDQNPLSQRLAALNSQLVQVDSERAAGSATHEQVVKALALPEVDRLDALLAIDAISQDNAVEDQVRAVARDASEVATMSAKYGERHPRLIDARASLATQRNLLRQCGESAGATVVSSQERRQQQAVKLKTLIQEQEQALKEYRKDLLALGSLSEVTGSHNLLYQTILTRLNEMEVDSSLNERKTKVIDPPTASLSPVNINQGLMTGLPFLLGILAAVGAALVVETTDTRLYGARQIQRLTGLPVVGMIPQSRLLSPLGRDGDPENPQHVAESFRLIRAAVRLARRSQTGCERIAIISCTPGEGKSTVTARLAMSLASMGARVLLIDADMRRPTQDEQMGEHTARGLSSLLAGEPGIAPVTTRRPNLDYLGVGLAPTNPGEQLLSPLLAEAIEGFATYYDYIIVDTPPLSVVADSLSIAEHMDDIILVLREGYTDKDMLNLVTARMAPMMGKLIGFVLNGDRSRAAAYYGKQYGNNYRQTSSGSNSDSDSTPDSSTESSAAAT